MDQEFRLLAIGGPWTEPRAEQGGHFRSFVCAASTASQRQALSLESGSTLIAPRPILRQVS